MKDKSDRYEDVCDVLESLVTAYGFCRIQSCLEVIRAREEDDEEDFAVVWEPDIYVSTQGRFYRASADGLEEIEPEFNECGKPYILIDGRQLWAHDQVYKNFRGPYDSSTHVVKPRDNNPQNCRLSNLILVRKNYRFRG